MLWLFFENDVQPKTYFLRVMTDILQSNASLDCKLSSVFCVFLSANFTLYYPSHEVNSCLPPDFGGHMTSRKGDKGEYRATVFMHHIEIKVFILSFSRQERKPR